MTNEISTERKMELCEAYDSWDLADGTWPADWHAFVAAATTNNAELVYMANLRSTRRAA